MTRSIIIQRGASNSPAWHSLASLETLIASMYEDACTLIKQTTSIHLVIIMVSNETQHAPAGPPATIVEPMFPFITKLRQTLATAIRCWCCTVRRSGMSSHDTNKVCLAVCNILCWLYAWWRHHSGQASKCERLLALHWVDYGHRRQSPVHTEDSSI